MRAALVFLLMVLLAAPAAAGEPSGAEETTPLSDLIDEVEREIALYRAAENVSPITIPLPGGALTARIESRMLRADERIGSVRARAHDRLHFELEGTPFEVVHFLNEDDDAESAMAALQAEGATPLEVWESSDFVSEWLMLQDRIAELRELVAPGSPDRVCPVAGETWFQDEWAIERPWGRIHKGVDLHAELGTELVAIEDGVVVQASWHWLGGRQVYLRADSTGDVYYYAHLDYWPKWLWTGTRLEAGDYLGLAGSSGNADTPHLHLGWMPGSGDVDLDNLQNAYPLMYELCH